MRRTAWTSTCSRDAAREPVPGPDADGALAGLAHHLLLLRGRVPGDRRVHRVARPQARQPRPARAGAHLGQGDGRAVRGGRGVRHAAVVRDGHPVARPDGAVRRGVRLPVRAGGLRLLHRGDLRRDLPVRLGPDVAAGAHAQRDPDDHLRDGRGVLRHRRQRLDEQPDRLRPRRGRAGGQHRSGRARCSARRPGRSSCTCAWPRSWSPGSRSPRCTRSGCCAAAATATTASGC